MAHSRPKLMGPGTGPLERRGLKEPIRSALLMVHLRPPDCCGYPIWTATSPGRAALFHVKHVSQIDHMPAVPDDYSCVKPRGVLDRA
jgi:hypothetical protein